MDIWFSGDGTNGVAIPQNTLPTGGSNDGSAYWNSEPTDGSACKYNTGTKYYGSASCRAESASVEANFTAMSATYAAGAVTGRFYFRLTAAPTQDFMLSLYWADTWTKIAGCGVSTDRKIFTAAGALSSRSSTNGGGTQAATATAANTFPLNTWVRVESRYTASTMQVRMWWTNPESVGTPDYDSGVLSFTAMSVGAGVGGFFQGVCTYHLTAPYTCIPTGEFAYIDQCVTSVFEAYNWIGPVGGTGGKTEQSFETSVNDAQVAQFPSGNMIGPFRNGNLTAAGAATATPMFVAQNTVVKSGSMAAKVAAAATSATYYQISEFNTNYTWYSRAYYRLTAATAADTALMHLMANGYSKCHGIGISTDRKFFARSSQTDIAVTLAGAQWSSAANAVPLNAWFRVETKVTLTTMQVKVWITDPDGTGTPDYDSGVITVTALGWVEDYRIGAQSFTGAWNTILAAGQNMYMDSLAVASDNWIGPPVQVDSRTVTSAITANTTVTATTYSANSTSVTSAITAATTVTAENSSKQGSVTSAITAAATVSAVKTSNDYYPESTRIHARTTVADSPSDPVKGGPAILGSLATELEQISADLINAFNLPGHVHADVASLILAVWAAIESKAAASHTHSGYEASGAAASAQAYAIQRANHTGTQLASTISDFATAVRLNRLDQMTAPTAAVAFGSQKITELANGTNSTDAVNKGQLDAAIAGVTPGGSSAVALVDGIYPEPSVATTAPTVTVTQTATPTSGYSRAANSAVTPLGGNYADIGSTYSLSNVLRQSNNAGNWYVVGFEFETEAAEIDIFLASFHSVQCRWKLVVDGQYTTDAPNGPLASGAAHRIHVNFGSRARRRVRIESQQAGFGGVYVPVTDDVWPTSRDIGQKVLAVGDSHMRGYRGTVSTDEAGWWVWDSYPCVLGRDLNLNVCLSGVDGAGYLAGSSTFRSRLTTDVLPLQPDEVWLCGSVNDYTYSAAAVAAEAALTFDAYKTALPATTKIRAIGPTMRGFASFGNLATINPAVRLEAAARGIDHIDCSTFITGTGSVAGATGNGNADRYITSDGAHFSTAGSYFVAKKIAKVLRGLTKKARSVTPFDFAALRSQLVHGSGRLPIQVATIPTISQSTSATIGGTPQTIQPNDARLRYWGSPVTNVGNYLGIGFTNCMRQDLSTYPQRGGAYTIGDFIDVEFETDTNVVEFAVITSPGNGDPLQFRFKMWENDEWIWTDAQIGATPNATYYIKCTWGSSKIRRVRLELQGAILARVQIPVTATAWRSNRGEGLRAVCQSDSFGYAYNQEGGGASVWGFDSPYKRALQLLGCNVHNDVVSGSGFVSTVSGTVQTFGARFNATVVPLNPDILTVAGSVNDVNGYSLSAVQAAINTYFATARAALPDTIIYGIGGIIPGSEWRSSMETVEGYIKQACADNGCTFVKSTDFTSGTGNFGGATGNGNSDIYVSADRYHLVDPGSDYAAQRLASSIGGDLMRRAALR